MKYKKRRLGVVVAVALIAVGYLLSLSTEPKQAVDLTSNEDVLGTSQNVVVDTDFAVSALETLAVKGRAPKTDYKRSNFGDGWEELTGCDVRNYILKRDLKEVVTFSDKDCRVVSGVLNDPYTGKTINFIRGADTSDDVQIDHVVALSDAWQKGAQSLTFDERVLFANDGLNLLAVDGETNQQKSNSDAASWLPSNKSYRCQYVARQIAVKQKYKLWVTQAEKNAMDQVLKNCPDQRLPVVSNGQ